MEGESKWMECNQRRKQMGGVQLKAKARVMECKLYKNGRQAIL